MENRYKILAVDDEKFNLLLLESCLQSESCDLVTCNDVLKAFSEFKKADFDVILLDILMDGIDGFEVRQLIRSRNKKIPIIFLTSLLDDINSTLVNRITADQYSYYLNKSFNKKTLIEKIEQAVQTYRESAAANGFLQKIESDLALAGEVQRLVLPNWCQINDQLIPFSMSRTSRYPGTSSNFTGLPTDGIWWCSEISPATACRPRST